MIKLVKEMIVAEENNYIYVNVASGSKIQAIACMMACMILKECKNIQPFYAEPETYEILSSRWKNSGDSFRWKRLEEIVGLALQRKVNMPQSF